MYKSQKKKKYVRFLNFPYFDNGTRTRSSENGSLLALLAMMILNLKGTKGLQSLLSGRRPRVSLI